MSVPASLLDALKIRYAEPHRHYHTWTHVEALLRHYERLKADMARPEAVLRALYWHDAIYDPRASDNEARSADLLIEEGRGPFNDDDDLGFAATIIRATARHLVPEGLSASDTADLSLFLDIDLSILAAPAPVFDQYERDVRAEYAFVSDEAFRAGRLAVLKTFMDRDRLYVTPMCRTDWEDPARANLARSIAALEVGASAPATDKAQPVAGRQASPGAA